MGIVGRRIQKEVGEADPGQVLVLGDMVGEEKAVLVYAQPGGPLEEMGARGWPRGKPGHRASKFLT